MTDFGRFDAPRRALLYVDDIAYEIEVIGEGRARYQVRGVTDTEIRISRGTRVIRRGVTTSVPKNQVEFR